MIFRETFFKEIADLMKLKYHKKIFFTSFWKGGQNYPKNVVLFFFYLRSSSKCTARCQSTRQKWPIMENLVIIFPLSSKFSNSNFKISQIKATITKIRKIFKNHSPLVQTRYVRGKTDSFGLLWQIRNGVSIRHSTSPCKLVAWLTLRFRTSSDVEHLKWDNPFCYLSSSQTEKHPRCSALIVHIQRH